MPDDVKLPADVTLSEAEVKRVLERAVEIDSSSTVLPVSEVAQAASEAGISEKAMLQAVQELLRDRDLVSASDLGMTTSGEPQARSQPWLRTAGVVLLLVIGLMVFYFLRRTVP